MAEFIIRIGKYFWAPISYRLKNKYLFLKYKKNYDSRTINWDWDAINFNKVAVLNLLLSKFNEPLYLEIGCDKNETFNSIPYNKKIGVDPKRGGTIRKTSDEFFKSNNDYFDVIFIDGDHTYEQCRIDLQNSLNFSKKGSYIVLHDLLPSNWFEHHVPRARTSVPWTGNVWKVAFELAFTSGIEFKVIKLDYGVGVIKLLTDNVVLFDRSKELADKEFDWFYENYKLLPIIGWTDFHDLILDR